MLIYEALVDQAKTRGLPSTKLRGILREYLQVLVLKSLGRSDFGKSLFFTGGTYLRLIHNLKRFSEDLDFNTENISKEDFEESIHQVIDDLKKQNINSHSRFKHWQNIYAADLIFPDIEKAYNVISKYAKKEGIIIKIETNRPKWHVKSETHVISGFGELYPCICTDISAFFADKIDAMNKKERARHIYDVMFMLAHHFPIDKHVLSALGIKSDPLQVISRRIAMFSHADLKKQAETLRPFLFDEKEADIIINAQYILPALIEKYRDL
jgi:predicted nucleotidyltransferase component of viral defense system